MVISNTSQCIVYTLTMIRKSVEYEQAVQLRKRGFTYVEIAKITNVSKSTISQWLSRETWSLAVKEDNAKRAAKENKKRIALLNKARGNQYQKLYAEAERSAITEYKHYKSNPLFIAGIMLYLSIGDLSSANTIRMSSSRKSVHKTFILFTREYLGVPREKVRFWLLIPKSKKPLAVSRSWSRTIHVPLSQFHKYQVAPKKSVQSALHDGVGNTIIGGTVSKRKLLKWIELATKEVH